MFKNQKGFTLAEVLITLTIIGVVAALTIPNLIAYYQKNQYVTQLKKVYTQMSQAVKLLMVDESVDTVSKTSLLSNIDSPTEEQIKQNMGTFLKKYFKVIKDCGTEFSNHTSACFADKYTNINGTEIYPLTGIAGYSVITADGTSMAIGIGYAGIPEVFVDINGPKRPNVGGRDLFSFSIYYDGSIEDGIAPSYRQGQQPISAYEAREIKFEEYCFSMSYGQGCFGKILNDNWKMDY